MHCCGLNWDQVDRMTLFYVCFNTHTGKIKQKKYDGVCIKLKSVLVLCMDQEIVL